MTENQRKFKKIFTVGVIFLLIIVYAWIAFKPKEQTCFNGIKNANEEGIDCGGACEKTCPRLKPPQVQDVNIELTKALNKGEGEYTLLAKLSNNNESWGISSVDYEFVVHGENGDVLGVKKGWTYAMPKGFLKTDGFKYVIEDNFKTDKRIGKVDFKLSNFSWKKVRDTEDLPDMNKAIFEIKNTKHGYDEDGQGHYYASGVTKNISRYSFKYVDIIAVLFDKNNNLVAAGKTDQWTVRANSGWEFKIYWNEPFNKEIDRVDYSAETNVFDSENFMQIYGTGEYHGIPR